MARVSQTNAVPIRHQDRPIICRMLVCMLGATNIREGRSQSFVSTTWLPHLGSTDQRPHRVLVHVGDPVYRSGAAERHDEQERHLYDRVGQAVLRDAVLPILFLAGRRGGGGDSEKVFLGFICSVGL